MMGMAQRVARRSLALGLLLAAAFSFMPARALAALCFQRAGGVPGAYSEAPRWWSSTIIGSSTNRWVDDPRWRGATAVGGLNDQYRFRGLVEQVGTAKHLVLMWHLKGAPTDDAMAPPSRVDRIVFGFIDDASGDGIIIRIDPTPLTGTPHPDGLSGTAAGFGGKFYYRTGTAGAWKFQDGDPDGTGGAGPSFIPPLPTWLKTDGRVDVLPACNPPTLACVTPTEWAVRVRLPILPGADLSLIDPTGIKIAAGGSYKFFYQVQDALPGGLIANYSFPAGLTTVQTEPNSCFIGICVPADSNWGAFTDTATCTGDITLTKSDIFVGTTGNTQIDLDSPNVIHAEPNNNTAATDIPADGIKATFRIANWGSTIGVSPAWETPPGCADVPGSGTGGVGPTEDFDIRCNYNVPVGDRCRYLSAAKKATAPFNTWGCGGGSGDRHPDQCVLVDLAANGLNGPFVFAPQSEYKNLMFTGASIFTQEATLDIQGIKALPTPAPKRDLFVFIKTTNMPARIDEKTPPSPALSNETLQGVLKKLRIQLPARGGIGKEIGTRLMQAIDQGMLTVDDVAQILPTYEAFVWHDTGETLGSRRVIESQPSFTYMMWHEGVLHGWKHAFEGADITELAPNFYKVSTPEAGTTTVKTTIEAIEEELCADGTKPPCLCPDGSQKPCEGKKVVCPDGTPPPCAEPGHPWWIWLLVLLGLVILVLVLLRFLKKKP